MTTYLSDEHDEKLWAIDIEGDGLPSNKVWCLTAKNIGTGEERRFTDDESIRSYFREQQNLGCCFIAHNGIEYDFPTLNRVVGTAIPISKCIDTMLLSMLYSPSLDGGHSLAAWGERLRYPKGEWNDFSKYSTEMEEYCMNDTRLLALLYKALRERMKKVGFSETGCEIEHRSWELIRQQRKNGFAFNLEEAMKLYAKLRGIENDIAERVHEYWPPKLECVFTGKKAFKQDGSPTSNYTRHVEQYVDVRLVGDGSYECYEYVYFNLGSPAQRVEKLTGLGWEPLDDEWTVIKKGPRKGQKGSPTPIKKGKLVPSMEKFVEDSGKEEVRLLAKWMEINARANMINTWIEAYNHDTGCIHGRLWMANTLRYRHSNPNTANIPAVRIDNDEPVRGDDGVFTYEARDLWTVRNDDRVLVGVDAKGIQLRVLAHYLNNKDFTDAVLDGDPHSYNQEIGGFATRAIAKTFIYAFLLGCGDAKAGVIIGGTKKDGREVKERFVGNFPGLSRLLDDLARQVERTGRIVLCDGTPILVKQPHTRLGYLLQGDESRIMKKAAILTAAENRKRNLDILKVGDIHDEWQNDCLRAHSEEFAYSVCPASFRASGEFFNYNLPIDCDAKIGMTWAETH